MRRRTCQILVIFLISCIGRYMKYLSMFYHLPHLLIRGFSFSGQFLSMLPVDPKLGKMLVMGAIFRCFDPVLTVVAGLSVRDPFLLPQDKKDVSSYFNSSCSGWSVPCPACFPQEPPKC